MKLFYFFVGNGADPDERSQFEVTRNNGMTKANVVAMALKKLRTSKGDYWVQQWFSSIASLFKIGTSRYGKRERIRSFKSSSLWYGKSILLH